MLNLRKILEEAYNQKASDVHLKVGNYPHIRVEGLLRAIEGFDKIDKEDTVKLIREILNPRQQEIFKQKSEVDFSFGAKGLGRFRAAVFQQRGSIAFAFRLIPTDIPKMDDLNLPNVLVDISNSMRGLVLVTGITGSGKSTTIASMIRYLNETRNCHILTIEDPIEFMFEDDQAIISQREISTDTVDFASALKAAMRQDPDVIMVGEMRDVETVRSALQAAQTGHLVLSTLHTTDALTTVDRIISLFPVAQQRDIRLQFAAAMNAVISMRLIRSSLSGRRLPAVEVLRNSELVTSLLSEADRTREIRGAMETGFNSYGMQTFDQSILGHFNSTMISEEDALKNATAPADMRLKMKGIVGASDVM